ncbi:hypothetical protein OS493_039968, partial [Desmophyllum pertusum]
NVAASKSFRYPLQENVGRPRNQDLVVTEEENVQAYCYLNDICQSINISPRLDNDMWRCELSDTDDKQNPECFEEAVGYRYTQLR